MGRLTRDPELRHTQSNMAVASFTLAIDRGGRKGPNGEKQTDFIDCVALGRTAEFVSQWFSKGMMAIAVGRIQSRNWEDRNGNKRVSIEVNCDEVSFGESKKSQEQNAGYRGGYDNGSQVRPEGNDYGAQTPAPSFDLPVGDSDFAELGDDDGDVPF